MNIDIIAAIIATLMTSLFGFISSRLSKSKKESDDIINIYSTLNLKNYLDKSIEELNKTEVLWKNPKYADEVIENLKINYDAVSKRLIMISSTTEKKEAEKAVKEKFDELKKRIEEIEKRFPKEATIEKVASINDAILATSIESINESIKRIENKILSKWDVAKIVFQIIATIGGLTVLIFGILQFIKK